MNSSISLTAKAYPSWLNENDAFSESQDSQNIVINLNQIKYLYESKNKFYIVFDSNHYIKLDMNDKNTKHDIDAIRKLMKKTY